MNLLKASYRFIPYLFRAICLSLMYVLFFNHCYSQSNQAVEISSIKGDYIDLLPNSYWLIDSTKDISPDKAFTLWTQRAFQAAPSSDTLLESSSIYWLGINLKNLGQDSSFWMLRAGDQGLVDLYWKKADILIHRLTGKYQKERFKDFPQSHLNGVRIQMAPMEERLILIRLKEIDHAPIWPFLRVYEYSRWLELDQDPLDNTVNFFQGIFWIMFLYNMILFFTVGFRAYLHYAMYLACVALFVLVAVGMLRTPPFGPPTFFYQLGYLAFGAINIFYFQFGRSLLDTPDVIPRWDKYLLRYIQLKTLLLIFLQLIIFFTFNLTDVLKIEFAMIFIDILISVVLFIVLMQKRNPLVSYFVLGSAAVILGLSMASIGHLFAWENSFEFFLSTIVFEIICFSLALGYRIRQSEKEKLAAKEEKLQAQQQLNQELSKVNTAFGRFVPHRFLQSIGRNSVLDVKLGDSVEREVTVLFSDIRGYTTLSENMSPEENFQFLNTYLGRLGPVIQQHRGFVNQYYGDGIMALFMEGPDDAIKAAEEMQKTIHAFNLQREKAGLTPITAGIGIHSGPLMMGVIGDTLRMDTGVVSDSVNTASRMEGLTKYFQAPILMSDATYSKLKHPDSYAHRFLGKVVVKGRKEVVEIYEFYGGDEEAIFEKKSLINKRFGEALSFYYKKEFSQAASILDQLLDEYPDDTPSQYYKQLCIDYILSGVSDEWTGVELIDRK